MPLFYNINYNCLTMCQKFLRNIWGLNAMQSKLWCMQNLPFSWSFIVVSRNFELVSLICWAAPFTINIKWDNKCLHRLAYCIQARVSAFFFISFTYDKKDCKALLRILKKIFTCNIWFFSIKNWRRIIYLVNVFACRIDEFVIFDKGNRMHKND